MIWVSQFVIYRESWENKVKFQFEVPKEVAEAHALLSKSASFFGLSPRMLTIQLYMRALDVEKQKLAVSAPKTPPPPKETADACKMRECKEKEVAEAQHEARVSAGWAAHYAQKEARLRAAAQDEEEDEEDDVEEDAISVRDTWVPPDRPALSAEEQAAYDAELAALIG